MSRHHCWSSTVENMAALHHYTSGIATGIGFIYLFIFNFLNFARTMIYVWSFGWIGFNLDIWIRFGFDYDY